MPRCSPRSAAARTGSRLTCAGRAGPGPSRPGARRWLSPRFRWRCVAAPVRRSARARVRTARRRARVQPLPEARAGARRGLHPDRPCSGPPDCSIGRNREDFRASRVRLAIRAARAGMRRGRHGGLGACLLGLERLEGAQGVPELGQRRAAIAQQRVERARPVAIADHGQTEAGGARDVLREQLGLLAAGLGNGAPTPFRRPSTRPARAARWRRRSGARAPPAARPGASSAVSAASRASKAARSSSPSTAKRRAHRPCFRAFCGERALPSAVLGPRDFAPFLRLASARALGRPKFGMTDSFADTGKCGPGRTATRCVSLAENRNNIYSAAIARALRPKLA
jgi:hypothetical protein